MVEYYLLNPTQVPKMKGKRGKDFIYSLVHNLDQKSVATYKDQIHQIGKAFGDMEDLFKDMVDVYNRPYEKQTKEEKK